MKRGKFFTQTQTREGPWPSSFGCIMLVLMSIFFLAAILYPALCSVLEWKHNAYINVAIFAVGAVATFIPFVLELPDPEYERWKKSKVCRRKWYARHWLNLVPLEASSALQFGIAIHAALDVLYKSDWDLDAAITCWREQPLAPDVKRTSGVGELIIREYHDVYINQDMEALQCN